MNPPDYPARPLRRGRGRREHGAGEEETTRTFVAVFPGEEAGIALGRLRSELEPKLPALRWVAGENQHFTLRFFGNQTPSEIERAVGVVDEIAPQCVPFPLELTGLGVFPGWKRPRVLWVGAGQGGHTLEALARALEREFRAARLGKADKPFRAHLTVGRWRDPRPEALAGVRDACEGVGQIATFPVRDVRIMKSTLGPGGPTYEVLHAAKLGPS